MSFYYNGRKTKGNFDPESDASFKISRSKIDLFIECPRCFYLDKRLGVSRPPGFPFNLNSAVDALLKKEFDVHRAGKTTHPLMEKYGVDAVPFEHDDVDKWRNTLVGVRFLHRPTNFLVFGAVDDVWINPTGELHIVDYKATSKDTEVNLDADWQDGYKRQVEIYQWLFRQNGFKVSDTAYFVYANGRRDRKAFDGKLEFDVTIIPYKGKDDWISGTLQNIREVLTSGEIPKAGAECDYCRYRQDAGDVLKEAYLKQNPRRVMKETKLVSAEKIDEKKSQTLF